MEHKKVKKHLSLAERAKHGLLWFLFTMLVLTFVSRAASEALVAKVRVQGVGSGIIDKSVSGSGIWSAEDVLQQRAEFSGLRIDRIHVQAGDTVKKGDPLYTYEMKSIEEIKKNLSAKIEGYELQIKQLKTGRSDSKDGAALALSQAERDLALAQNNLDNAAYQIVADKSRAYQDALFAYETQTMLQDSEINAAEQAVAAAQTGLNPADPATQDALNNAQAALRALQARWESSLAEPLRKLNQAHNEWSSIQNGTYDYSSDLASYQTGVTSASRALETARFNYEQSKKNDSKNNANIGYQVDGVDISLDAEQEKYDALMKLAAQNGMVASEADGLVTAVNAQSGNLTDGSSIVTLSIEGLVLKIQMPLEQAVNLSAGDSVTLMKDGKAHKEKMKIAKIGAPDQGGQCIVVCAGDAGEHHILGSSQQFIIEKATNKQNLRIPIQALREEGNGKYYVLIMGKKETILGEQNVAVRVNVQIIEHDEQYVAIEGGISQSDKLIISNNKPIRAGDRVVLRDE